jgi:peptidyl-prolyl cis-trans isomerase D
MPFEVFRRHQKKLLAVLAIFAMVAFTLDFSLINRLTGPAGAGDTVVVSLNGQKIRRSDLNQMAVQRTRANRLVGRLVGLPDYQPFGPVNTRALVDAIILEREADALGMTATVKLAKDWLRSFTNGKITSEMFDAVYRTAFSADEVTEEGLLLDLANQLRITNVMELPGSPQTTPLDVYRAYRDQYERVSASAIRIPVADYIAKVSDPSDAELTSFYEKYKNVLPDRKRDTPGFMAPRRVRAEYISIDGAAISKALKAKLTEKELRAAYDARKSELPIMPTGLPDNLFVADSDPKAARATHDPFYEIRPYIETLVADEKAREAINRVLGEVKDKEILNFSEKYANVVDSNKESKRNAPLPMPGDLLKQAAKTIAIEGTKAEYDETKLVDRDEAEHLPFISSARVGLTASSDGQKFADKLFNPRDPLYDPIELTDSFDRRYLLWKVEDVPAHVPPLSEIRSDVVTAWKTEKARPLAEKDAESLAGDARKKAGDLTAVAGKRLVITTDPVPRMQPSPSMMGQLRYNPPRPSDIPQIPDAGPNLRDALFGLNEKEVIVAANEQKDAYYVLALNRRFAADFNRLFDLSGPYITLRGEVRDQATMHRGEAWMNALRAQAGLPADWKPTDEKTEFAGGED